MTDANYTHITVVIDSSGSMAPLSKETRDGFNAFLEEHKALPGKATMEVWSFSSGTHLLQELQPLTSVGPLTEKNYQCGGGTALLDAVGQGIDSLGNSLKAMPENQRPGKVVFVVVTDGQENCSLRFSKQQISAIVKHQEEAYNWNFLYLGANVDAFHESADLGIRGANAINFTASSTGVKSAYGVMSASLGAVRSIADQDTRYEVFSTTHVDNLAGVAPKVAVVSTTTPDSKS